MTFRIIFSCLLSLLFSTVGSMPTHHNRLSQDLILTIYHYRMPCAGENIQWCFLIRVNNGEEQNYLGQVQGLNYQWGYRYTISAEKIKLENPPADAPCFTYKLKNIIKMEKMAQASLFNLPLEINGESLVQIRNGVGYILGERIIQTGGYSLAAVSRAKAATFSYKTGKQPGLVLIKIEK